MGLTKQSTGTHAVDSGLVIHKLTQEDKVIALAGNPNVGKSTVFNELTGLNQHTGNWPGKTVTNAQGNCTYKGKNYVLVDIPGTYSLMAHSAEEEVARDFICFGEPDATIVVCDATCLERKLNLVLHTLEITKKVVVCVNLLDEARRKKISLDLPELSRRLGVPVVGTAARSGEGLQEMMEAVSTLILSPQTQPAVQVEYIKSIEEAIARLQPVVEQKVHGKIDARWLSLKLLDYDETLIHSLDKYLGVTLLDDWEVAGALDQSLDYLKGCGISRESLRDKVVAAIVLTAEKVCRGIVHCEKETYLERDRKIDHILTSKWTGIPIMIALLAVVFWITITGANYPSQLLSDGLFWVEDKLADFFVWAGSPDWLCNMLVHGVYRVLAWVVSVMLPPMAIFFPLFTLLEDLGYLPRIAFNLDKYFKKCSACGKQALTMCMGTECMHENLECPVEEKSWRKPILFT